MGITTASFTPLTITVETLQVLSKQDNYANLLALYMAYVEVTTWQKTNNVKATKSFMLERLGWGNIKFNTAKASLIELGLIENIIRHDDGGKVSGHYVLIKHVIQKPEGGFQHQVVNQTPNTNDLHINTNDLQQKKSHHQKETELLLLVNEVTGRQFRTLPSVGVKKTIDAFTMDEIRQSLKALVKDDWHKEKIKELNISYLVRATTIDKFLGISQPSKVTEERDRRNRYVEAMNQAFREHQDMVKWRGENKESDF